MIGIQQYLKDRKFSLLIASGSAQVGEILKGVLLRWLFSDEVDLSDKVFSDKS